MMVITIPVTVEEVTQSTASNAPLRLGLQQEMAFMQVLSSVSLNGAVLDRMPALQGGNLLQKRLLLVLEERDDAMHDVEPSVDGVSISKLERQESIRGGGSYVTCVLEAATRAGGGRFSITPCPYYDVKVRLTEEQFDACRGLSPSSYFVVRFEDSP
jgi:hypothetical protein